MSRTSKLPRHLRHLIPNIQPEAYLRPRIDYIRSLTRELVVHHETEWRATGKRLLSAVLFGPLASGNYSEEIWLFEVVEGYPYPSDKPEAQAINFKSTRTFPLFGHLRLWVMSPEEFRDAVAASHPFAEQLRAEPKEYILDIGHRAQKLLK